MNTREIVHDMLDKLDDKQINALKIIIEGLVNEAADPQNTVKNKLKAADVIGRLNKYADPDLIPLEDGAWERDIIERIENGDESF